MAVASIAASLDVPFLCSDYSFFSRILLSMEFNGEASRWSLDKGGLACDSLRGEINGNLMDGCPLFSISEGNFWV